LSRFFALPLVRNAQKRDKKKSNQTTEGEEKKRTGKKNMCDEPRWIFLIFFLRVFELPLLRNAQKRDKKQSIQTTEGERKKRTEKKKHFL
jgi:hypothetical protein